MNDKVKPRILIVCMGNICRSPTGEAVLRATAERMEIDVEVDSAGTIGYHEGDMPDYRARTAGEKRGYSFEGMRARQIREDDFSYFDHILVADRDNLTELLAICPVEFTHKLSLFLSHSEMAFDEIPDPYYGGDRGFEFVLDLIEEGSEGILKKLDERP